MVGVSSIIYMLSAVVFAKLAETDFCGKLGAERWIPLVFALTAVYCGVVPQCTHVAEVFCLQLLPGMSTGILATYLISEAMKEIPAGKKSTAMGFFQAVYAIGMALLPALCGQITQMRTIGTAYCFLGGICLMAGVGSVLFFRKEKEG